MSIESYGGNPDIVATREEIQRVAFEIKLCVEELTAWPPLETLLSDPLRQLQFRLATIGIEQKLQRLHAHCILAAENYFTIEAQIQHRFEITFVPELARIFSQLATSAGWRLDKNVRADFVSERRSSKPSSITKILDRLWELSSKDQPTVGIDLFDNSFGTKTAIVYIPGTQSLGFGEGRNPLDMASNIQAIGETNQAASEKAVLLAIRQAGITPKDQVIFVGHSQGGMVAGNLAANPIGFISAGLITFGAPLAQVRNLKVPVMAVEHVNDPVPNLSGKANPLKGNWVTVQRVSEKSESNAVLFSHSLKSYKNTSVEIDSSSDVGVRNIKSQLLIKLEATRPSKSFEFRISRESQ